MFGIIDVGGGTRGIYSSGIYDAFMDKGFEADYCLAVSAGAPNLITYVAKQRGRMFTFFYEYFQRKESLGFKVYMKTGSYVNFDYLYSDLSNEGCENPLDLYSVLASETKFKLVVSEMETADPIYVDKNQIKINDYEYLKATCSLPMICRPIKIDGSFYCDGAIADQFPFEKAFEDGCDKLLIVLTKPREEYLKKIRVLPAFKLSLHKYPDIYKKIKNMHINNKKALEEISALERENKVVVLEPKNRYGMKTLTTDKSSLMKMYQQGYKDGIKFVEAYLNKQILAD